MDIQPLEILKWIGIVVAAGFVGYFGRYLAMMVLRQTKKEKPPAKSTTVTTAPVEPSVRLEEARLKLEKKKAKQAAKQAKKSGEG